MNEPSPGDGATPADAAASPTANTVDGRAESQGTDLPVSDSGKVETTANADPMGGSVVPPWLPLVAPVGPPVTPKVDAPVADAVTPGAPCADPAAETAVPAMVLQAMRQAPTAKTGEAPVVATGEPDVPPTAPLPASAAAPENKASAASTTTTQSVTPAGFDQALQAAAATTNGAEPAPQAHAMLAMRGETPAELHRLTASAPGPGPQTLPMRGEAAHAAVSVPVSNPGWNEAFASRIAMQVRDGVQQVSLALNPSELGPVEVRLSVSDGQVSAHFQSAHPHVRQAIEEAMPKLREMLSQSGLSLADSNVSQQAPQRRDTAFGAGGRASGGDEERMAEGESVVAPSVSSRSLGLVDAYV